MTEYVTLGKRKRGDDWRFRGILVSDSEGNPIDLSADGWTVSCSLRPRIDRDSTPAIPLGMDEAELVNSRVVLTLAKELTRDAEPRIWYGDLQVDGPNGRHSSETFQVVVKRDQTIDE